MRQARDRQRESIALSGSNPGKSVANIFRHRSSSKRGHELPPLLNDNKVFLTDDTDKAELFSAFFAKHLATESDPRPNGRLAAKSVPLSGAVHGSEVLQATFGRCVHSLRPLFLWLCRLSERLRRVKWIPQRALTCGEEWDHCVFTSFRKSCIQEVWH
ncbi:hypothetical protein SprV_0100441200 [Sparganum proliferum]